MCLVLGVRAHNCLCVKGLVHLQSFVFLFFHVFTRGIIQFCASLHGFIRYPGLGVGLGLTVQCVAFVCCCLVVT